MHDSLFAWRRLTPREEFTWQQQGVEDEFAQAEANPEVAVFQRSRRLVSRRLERSVRRFGLHFHSLSQSAVSSLRRGHSPRRRREGREAEFASPARTRMNRSSRSRSPIARRVVPMQVDGIEASNDDDRGRRVRRRGRGFAVGSKGMAADREMAKREFRSRRGF